MEIGGQMVILIAFQIPYRKSNSMSIFPLTSKDFLFLAVSIFRHAIFGSSLLVVSNIIWGFPIFYGNYYLWACLFLDILFLVGVVIGWVTRGSFQE
jgi:hypothetical protein